MAHKVFVSYKYADSDVQSLNGYYSSYYQPTTVRDYVTKFEEKVKNSGIAIYKGESEGEDLSRYTENTIWEKLKDKIQDSSVTIVFISPNMKEPYRLEKDQWIPWEVAFSLREQSRSDRTSHSNSLVYVILPNRMGSYTYTSYMDKFKIIDANENNGYAEIVQWNRFLQDIPLYIDRANARKLRVASYLVCKSV